MSAAVSTGGATANHQALIFVYGTLKKGFPNHHLIEEFSPSNDAVFMGKYQTVKPFPLVCGPLGIPFLINKPRSGHRVKGELYSVSGRALARLDELEGISIGNYERLPIDVVAADGGSDGGDAVEAYFAHRSYGEEMWAKNGWVGMEEYLDSDGEKYVRVADRDVGLNLRDYIRLYLQNINKHLRGV
ncbi:hypothetical protein Cgig2_022091 [Carnegiea gigantea]|uniref:Gamma-glutamylcyclotransferase family protein n=1 Tax=Carnegiea gigantea TaxID=171969 RepID=A0A9Q1KRX6_9CARY|nr:hypothetical protein Cgig2_022091 [Carnegiea gigantea]